MKHSNPFGKKVNRIGVRHVTPTCTALFTIPLVLTRSNGIQGNVHGKILRDFYFSSIQAVFSYQYRGLHDLRPFKHFFPNKVFDFLIRLSCSYTLLSLDNFSNVTHCRKWLFFTPFAIVSVELDWDKYLPLVCFIVKESPFSQLLFAFPPCCFVICKHFQLHPILMCCQKSRKCSAVYGTL